MSRSESLEAARILAQYRRLVLLGRLRLPLAQARRLVGPDCAYHLYHRHAGMAPGTSATKPSRKPRRRSGR